ncbi:trichohyalin [Pogonomyrmex barbatus]|uniref:Trichohyalin n=1 Tax=Pogonomyrmex barbatus TaxID=144034 RepID=A0A6I9WKB9_9HYME|nr:trichohyalin [Pogonomyrmex barbatus]XP_011639876.1 trichohyalin [Pogonomyrmex barbatus]XP_011639877.1 trichohyalin [Pogonomyrmex barbatus]XP_011639878.1 trichohyalin [Pogonomyrmex barbatus]
MKTMGDVVADPIDENDGTVQPSGASKEFGQRTLRSLKRGLGRLWRRHRGNASITEYDPSYKVAYLGNVLTGWAKGEGCVEKPVSTLWRNYVTSSRPDVSMRLTVTNGGLTATTKDHGLTEYWAHRVTYCTAPASHPRLFVWVYRHEGRRLRPELRCHAALCSKESTAKRLASILNARLQQALMEFRRDKVSRQNARLSLANALYDNPSLPRRKLLLSTGGQNYRPPLERSKSAPKLSAIEEDTVAEEMEQKRLLEELRSLENVARSWEYQDSWRLARLLDVLNHESDENGSISSGCETASTATSEERATGPEEHLAQNQNDQRGSIKRVIFSEDRVSSMGPRRNSEGSPHFMTCAGSPRFNSVDPMKRFPLRSEEEESMEEEEEEMEDTASNMFDFEDVEDLDDVVDYRPRGEMLNRISEDPQKRERRANEKYPGRIGHEFLQNEETSFLTLDSLDEETDSDESGYVEAPPKSLLGQDDKKEEEENEHLRLEPFMNKKEDKSELVTCRTDGSENQRTKYEDSKIDKQEEKKVAKKDSLSMVNDNQRIKNKEREKERADFNYPKSETIRKLASASLRNSKSFEMASNNCMNILNNFKTSKSFDSVKNDEIIVDSPSLHQRKQLLAQRGVMV